MANPNVNAGNKYARDVVAGKIDECRYVRLACKRHLDDLAQEKNKAYEFYFDRAAAEKVCEIIQLLPHTKGEWAFKRMLITLEPWQLFRTCCVFGWKRKSTKKRRFVEVYSEIPRKNGKSAETSAIGVYLFAADGECGAEVYSGATTEKQAWEVFRPARLMCKRTPYLLDHFGIQVNAKNLCRPNDDSKFEPLIGDPGDGQSPSAWLVDEYHEHPNDSLYNTGLSGMGSRLQPLLIAITTAGTDISGACYDKRRAVVEMLEGITPDDQLFGIIYAIDEGDDWTDPKSLRKANPNMGVSVYSDYLLSQQQRAIKNPRFTNTFKTKHLNIWVTSKSAFFNMEQWKACEDKTITIDQFEGQECYLGFDLARKIDMNSMARLFFRDIDGKRHYYSVAPKFWVPEDTVFENDNKRISERYQKWVNKEWLLPTNGAEIDYREILAAAIEVNHRTPVLGSPIDPHGATNLAHHLDDEGLEPITITQNYTNLSDPMKELEAAIISERFHHDGHPIMTWCIANVVGKNLPGNDDVVRPIKENVESKIDGAVALMMCIGRAQLGDIGQDSIYNETEL